MTKLERRIAEVAEASGRNVYVGRKGHKEDWFAGCSGFAGRDGIECDGSSAWQALAGVVASLKEQADSTVATYHSQMQTAERLRDL